MVDGTAFQILLIIATPFLTSPFASSQYSERHSADRPSLSLSLCPFFHRPEKDGAATSVDTVCAYHSDPTGPGLEREQLYWELSQLTQGITKLGPYTLDEDSLYINGE